MLPEIALSTLFLAFSFFLVPVAWALNVSRASNVTPKIFGVVIVGSTLPSIDMFSGSLTSLFHEVKSVDDDFSRDRNKLDRLNHAFNVAKYSFRL